MTDPIPIFFLGWFKAGLKISQYTPKSNKTLCWRHIISGISDSQTKIRDRKYLFTMSRFQNINFSFPSCLHVSQFQEYAQKTMKTSNPSGSIS